MNVFYRNLGFGLLLLTSMPRLWSSSVACDNKLLIENKSNWLITIFYTTVVGGQMELEMQQGETLKELDTCLDKIATMSFARRGQIWGMYATKISLDEQLKALQAQRTTHSNKDAVITIDATITEWKLSNRWEGAVRGSLVMPEEEWEEKRPEQPKPQPVVAVQKPRETKPREIAVSLVDVQQGKLGAEYAQKVQDIINTDYTQAEKQGKVNLRTQLKREFSNVTIAPKTKDIGDVLSPTRISTNDAKNSINRLTRVLHKYRAKGLIK